MTHFHTYMEENTEKLDLYTTAITRAHGKSHPEAFDVRAIFERMQDKIKTAGKNKPALDAMFSQLHQVTNSFTIPDDVCETYAAVYKMLSEAERSYMAL